MAANPWLRLYREAMNDPKIVTLTDRLFRAWVNCLMMADDAGKLPIMRDVAVHMRTTVVEAEQMICGLVEAELIDMDAISGPVTTYTMHGWADRQFMSDSSKERVRRYRERRSNVTCNDDVTLPKRPKTSESYSETDTENKFFPSEQEAACAKEGNELGFNFGLKNGKGKRESIETIAKRAEGMGLDAADLIKTTRRAKPDKPTAYMTALCVNRLKGQLPGLDEQIIRDALWGEQQPYATVCQLLVEHTQ